MRKKARHCIIAYLSSYPTSLHVFKISVIDSQVWSFMKNNLKELNFLNFFDKILTVFLVGLLVAMLDLCC